MNNKNGFTLIELLVVISVISLLSSVVLASVQNARDKAYATFVISQIKEYTKALVQINNEIGTYPPVGGIGQKYCLGSQPCGAVLSPNACPGTAIPLGASDASLDSALSQYLPSLPSPSPKATYISLIAFPPGIPMCNKSIGARYYCSSVQNGVCVNPRIEVSLPRTNACSYFGLPVVSQTSDSASSNCSLSLP
jgi:prepilin-type N-terminal cleavage/methylation domain-containing protein